MPALHFISLGCPKNLVDSEVMLGLLAKAGFELVADPAAAEAIVVNTCAFIEDAKREAIDTILEMAAHKRTGRCRLLLVAGCLPQRYGKKLMKLLPEVDIFLGAGEFPRVAEIIRGFSGGRRMEVGRPSYLYDHEAPRIHTTPRHVAYLKIAEGCFHPCSFCIVPTIRGAFRSRAPDSVVEEARGMLSRGVRELVLIAQDTTAYGRDLGTSLPRLLERLSELPGLRWIRLLYAYPHELSREILSALRDLPGLCRYLDLPVQHISDRILTSMRRKGSAREVRRLIDKLRRDVPGISLRTSLIVGYPGETAREHDLLLDFVSEMRFEHLGVFCYSPEEGTPAARLSGRVPREMAEGRCREVMELQREISRGNNERQVGRRLTVLVEGISPRDPHILQARHEGQAPEIDGVVLIPGGRAPAGTFADVDIVRADDYDLIAGE